MRSGLLLALLSVSVALDPGSDEASQPEAIFREARAAKSPERAIELLEKAATLGHGGAQKMVGLAHYQGHGGLERNAAEAIRWFRKAAVQGDEEAAYNLGALCDAQPSCVKGDASVDDALGWLGVAAAQGLAEAAFQLGTVEVSRANSAAALEHFLAAAKLDHPKGMYNAAHLLATREKVGAAIDLTRALGLFELAARAASQQQQPKVEADAKAAMGELRRLWVQRVEAEADLDKLSEIFAVADAAATDANTTEPVAAWRSAVAHWAEFQAAFARQPSSQNADATAAMRRAVDAFSSLLRTGTLGECRRHLVLSKLVEGSKLLARDDDGIRHALEWHTALVETALCSELYATIETNPSCFNDHLAAAITMHRRLNDTAAADALVERGRAHPAAATRWLTSAQTPRVFHPQLAAMPWWDAAQFGIAAALEAAWASGEIAADLRRLGVTGSGGGRFERIVSTGAPIRSAAGDDLRGEGAWSEFMLFDGERWNEARCGVAQAICAALRAAPEVNGIVVGASGDETGPQGQVTIFRLVPGAHVLPHVGVTNKRLVLQFPLQGHEGVRFRVADEWRGYERGRAMVFDDSYEHEVVHNGAEDRYVVYATLHHPDLGMPTLQQTDGGSPAATCSEPEGTPTPNAQEESTSEMSDVD